ncbi:uncharacterized protein LOC108906625 [Anoplophora glabripennis]|uniref:uncharacterized protein LOC108906625 n=1 Tax=Anoplophora glabripennis TaxID=217634 RepID=UPI0008748A96|nr:uncharacterized protein LOC108906625 [Anoplophora glabripennis]
MDNNQGNYFTIAYILFTVAVILQVIYYSFVVYSYQNIKRKLVEKGRLLQVTPIIGIATVCVPPTQGMSYIQPSCPVQPQATYYPGATKVVNGKEAPPPYIP